MRRIVFAATVAIGAISLAACSQAETDVSGDEPEAIAEEALASDEAMAEDPAAAAQDAAASAAAEESAAVAATADDHAAAAAAAAADVEAAMQAE